MSTDANADTNTPAAPKAAPQATRTAEHPAKPIHSLILDTGPLIKNDPPVDTLRARATELYTTPAILAEIRDAKTRARIETTLLPFVRVRTPRADSVKAVAELARKTGDYGVLSRTDLLLLALTYEIAKERGGGDDVGKMVPTMQGFGSLGLGGDQTQQPPSRGDGLPEDGEDAGQEAEQAEEDDGWTVVPAKKGGAKKAHGPPTDTDTSVEKSIEELNLEEEEETTAADADTETPATATQGDNEVLDVELIRVEDGAPEEATDPASASGPGSGSDSDDWITPENLSEYQSRDLSASATPTSDVPVSTALLTSDYAMQNVALRANLPILSPSLQRITQLRTWVLRCHACFSICRDMDKQFCPKCGQATLLRASCSTDAQGQFRIHLKKNMQWNNRGNVYSMPKPTHGSSSGKVRSDMSGGGKNGWGRHLILAEDQKEYVRAVDKKRREKGRDLMDEDYLPGIVSGERLGGGGKIRIGAGRAVNSRKARQ